MIVKKDMTSGSPIRHILSFALPLFMGSLFQQFYSVTDTIIVSRTLGEDALAAVGSIGAVNFLILGFCMGLAGGFAVPVAQCFGARDFPGIKRYTGNILWLSLFICGAVTALSASLCRPILEVTRTPANIIDMTYDYLFVLLLGIPVTFAYNMLAGLMRSLGDSRSPFLMLVFSTILNIGLDLLFILVFHMGIMGASLATITAQVFSVLGCVMIIKKRFNELHLTKSTAKLHTASAKHLLRVGLPMGFLFSIMGIGSMLLQTSVNTLGSLSVAAVSAGGRLDGMLSPLTLSLGNAMTTYCAQNIGAGKIDRINKGVRVCVVIGLVYGLLVWGGVWLFGRYIALLFIDAESTMLLDMAVSFMRASVCFYWALSLVHIVRLSIQGLGYGKVVMFAGLLEMVGRGAVGVVFIPKFGFIAAAFASPAAWVLADFFLVPAFLAIMRREKKKVQTASSVQ